MKKGLFKHKPKRTTFGKMFAKAMILPVILTVAFAALLNLGIEYLACEQARKQQSSFESQLIQSIQFNEEKSGKFGDKINGISMKMGFGTFYDVLYEELTLPFIGGASSMTDKNGIAVSALIDSSGNVIATNSAKMWCVVRFGDKPDDICWLYCDPAEVNIPEVDKLVNDHIQGEYSDDHYYSYDIISAYINIEEHKMIPHEIKIYEIRKDEEDYESLEEHFRNAEVIVINADAEGFELMEFYADKYSDTDIVKTEYPSCGFENIWGVEKSKVDKAINDNYNYHGEGYNYESDYRFVVNESIVHRNVFFNGEKCTLFMDYKVNVWTRSIIKMYIIFVTVFFLFLTFIAFLRCWSRNVKNKAQYAFEDYQRALTNNLAHDLKTPLAVIGGYAENLMEMRKDSGDAKELQYLSSIMNNVSYTDDIIAKTLKLSKTEQTKKLNKKKVDIKALAEKCAEKYKTALEERGIELTIEGSGEVNADEDSLSLAVDNLISNAVKYTRNDGSVKITVSKKEFVIENDTAEDIDTKELKMPFVKGDKARSDKSSSGLGLSIAEAAAVQNGFTLKLSCKDKKFKAMIEM